MLPSMRDKKSGLIYKLSKKLQSQLDREYEAEQAELAIKIESDSDDELDSITMMDPSLLTGLKMTCSDSEDSAAGGSVSQTGHSEEHSETTVASTMFGLRNDSDPSELTIAAVLNMFQKLSKQITAIDKKADSLHKQVANISDRLGRVEKKVGVSLATLDHVKDSVIVPTAESADPNPLGLNFIKISNEEELVAFDVKLGTDEEFNTTVKTWLTMKLKSNDPYCRMHDAIDLLFERKFFAECSWTGRSKEAMKVCFSSRENVFQLFRAIGSNKFVTLDESTVKTFLILKLRHAANRVFLKETRKSTCRKRKYDRTMENYLAL